MKKVMDEFGDIRNLDDFECSFLTIFYGFYKEFKRKKMDVAFPFIYFSHEAWLEAKREERWVKELCNFSKKVDD